MLAVFYTLFAIFIIAGIIWLTFSIRLKKAKILAVLAILVVVVGGAVTIGYSTATTRQQTTASEVKTGPAKTSFPARYGEARVTKSQQKQLIDVASYESIITKQMSLGLNSINTENKLEPIYHSLTGKTYANTLDPEHHSFAQSFRYGAVQSNITTYSAALKLFYTLHWTDMNQRIANAIVKRNLGQVDTSNHASNSYQQAKHLTDQLQKDVKNQTANGKPISSWQATFGNYKPVTSYANQKLNQWTTNHFYNYNRDKHAITTAAAKQEFGKHFDYWINRFQRDAQALNGVYLDSGGVLTDGEISNIKRIAKDAAAKHNSRRQLTAALNSGVFREFDSQIAQNIASTQDVGQSAIMQQLQTDYTNGRLMASM